MARRSKDPQARIEALGQRLEKNPSSPAFFPLASLLWLQGDAPRAEKLLRSGLGVHPGYAAARVLLGEILLAMDRPKEAVKELAAAVEMSPWNLQGQQLLADCLRRGGDEAGARKALGIAAMFNPSDPEARALLEEITQAGASSARTSLPAPEAAPPAPVATPSLAQLYIAQGHHAQAAEVYRQLLRKEPDNAEWKKQLGHLEARLGGTQKAAPPASAREGLDLDFEEELAADAGGASTGAPNIRPSGRDAAPALDDDLDALLSEADGEQAAHPALDHEDAAVLADAGEMDAPAAPGDPAAGAILEDDLESFLGMGDEPAEAPPAPAAAASDPQEAALGGDLEGIFAEAEEEAASEAAGPQSPGDGLDLDALFLEEEEDASAVPPSPAPRVLGGETAPDAVLEENIFAEEEDSSPATHQAQAAPEAQATSGDELSPDALFLEEEEEGAPARADALSQAEASGADGAPEELGELDFETLLEEENGAATEAAPAAPRASGSDDDALADEELEGLFIEDEEEAASAAPASAGRAEPGPDALLDLDLEEEDLDLFLEDMEPGGAGGAEGIAASPEEEEVPAEETGEVPAPERGSLPPSGNGAEVDPFLRSLIGLYVEEGNLAQALDLCRKAAALGPPSAWLAGQMQAIESGLASGAGVRLQGTAKEDKEGEVRFLSPAEVVGCLEGWLQTLQRRKARMAESQ